MRLKLSVIATCVMGAMLGAGTVSAQTAGAKAEYNKAERQRAQENARLERVDPPVREDPLGNALIGGGATALVKGTTAGAVSAVRSGAIGSTVQEVKDRAERNKVDNAKTGRGSENDPRFDPRSILNN